MKYCDAYQLVSFFAEECEQKKIEKDWAIQATNINKLSDNLLENDVDSDFGYYALLDVEEDNPNVLKVESTKITIFGSYFANGHKFINHNKEQELTNLIRKLWDE